MTRSLKKCSFSFAFAPFFSMMLRLLMINFSFSWYSFFASSLSVDNSLNSLVSLYSSWQVKRYLKSAPLGTKELGCNRPFSSLVLQSRRRNACVKVLIARGLIAVENHSNLNDKDDSPGFHFLIVLRENESGGLHHPSTVLYRENCSP